MVLLIVDSDSKKRFHLEWLDNNGRDLKIRFKKQCFKPSLGDIFVSTAKSLYLVSRGAIGTSQEGKLVYCNFKL